MAASDVPSATAAGQVEIEVVAWITKFVGGDGSTRKVYHEPLKDGDTVRKVLRRLSGRFPQLHKALWDPDYWRPRRAHRSAGERCRARPHPHPGESPAYGGQAVAHPCWMRPISQPRCPAACEVLISRS